MSYYYGSRKYVDTQYANFTIKISKQKKYKSGMITKFKK